jgi:hypothetical protein
MAPPKDIARSYPKRGLTADLGFRSEPKFCGDGSTEFDGSADKVTAAHYNPSGDYLTTTIWFNADTIRNQGIAHNGNLGRNSFLFYMGSSNNIQFYWNDTTGDALITHQSSLNAGQWHHLAMVLDMSDPADHQATCYIDGIAATGTRTASGWVGDNTYQFGNQYAASGWFDGKIANCRIYDAALTQDQIRELYNNPGLDFPSGLTASNLRRHYKLETDFNDSGADSENATASGSPSFTVDRPQLPRGLDLARGAAMARVYTGRCVDFDGSADKIIAAHYNPSGDFLTTTAWVNADTLRGQGLIYNGSTGRNSFLFYMLSTGALRFYWNDTTGDAAITHQTTLTTGRWYHVAAVMDMSDPADHQVTFYIDGIAATGTRTASGFTGDNNYGIGLEYASTGWFDGKIANCRIYDVELTQAQIRELYHNPEQVLPTGVSASNLRRYYPLSDYNDTGGTGGRYFQDMGADGEPAEDQGSCTMAFAQPVPCPQLGLQQSATRLFFAGDTSQVVTASSVTSLGNSFAVAFWVQKDAGVQMFIETNLTDQIYYDGSQLYYYSASGGSNILTGASMPPGEWHHVVVTYGAVYLNGASVATFSSGGWFGTTNYFGRRASAAMPFNGIMANVTYWDENLTSAEALELYNQGIGYDPRNDTGNYTSSSDVVHYWKFDDLTTVIDRVGSANATVTGTFAAASFPENASGSTIVGDFSMKRKGVSVLNPTFDPIATSSVVGVSAEIPGCDAISFDPAKGMSFTLAFRLQSFKPTPTSVWYPRIFAANAAGSDYYLRFNYTHQILNFVFRDSASTTQSYDYTTGTVSDLDWHHIAITLDTSTSPNTTVKLWFDGALINTFSSANHNYAFTPDELRIGTYNYGNGNFPGAIANFRIYQAALSQGEVEQSYSSDMRLIKGLENV